METRRKELKIMNAIIVVLCIISIVGYFILDFFTLKMQYKLTATDLETILSKSEDTKDYVDYVDQAIGDGKVIKLQVKIPVSLLIGAFKTESAEDYINENFVDKFVDDFIDDMQDVISALVEVSAKSAVKESFESYAEEYVKNVLGEQATTEEAKKKLEELGVTEEYISEKTDAFFDVLSEAGTPLEKVAEEAVKIVEEVYQKIDEGINSGTGATLSEEDKQKVQDAIEDILDELCLVDENGNMKDIYNNAEEIINQLMGKLSNGGLSESAKANAEGNLVYKTVLFEDKTQDELQQEQTTLRKEIKGILRGVFTPIANKILLTFKAMFITLCASAFIWLWEIIKILFKSHRKNPGVKLFNVETLGWLPQFVLGFLPTLAFSLLPKLLVLLNVSGVTEMLEFVSRISFEVFTSGIVASISALILFIISFPYTIIRKRLKKDIKMEKRRLKAERKAQKTGLKTY